MAKKLPQIKFDKQNVEKALNDTKTKLENEGKSDSKKWQSVPRLTDWENSNSSKRMWIKWRKDRQENVLLLP